MALRVHIVSSPEGDALNALRAALVNVELTTGDEPPADADYEILVAGRPSRELLLASQKLRALVIPFAGLPKITVETLAEFKDLAVHNLHHNAAATAELAVALMLAAAKSMVRVDRRFRGNDWSDRGDKSLALQLAGRTALVVGFGAIGSRVGAACRGLAMEVIGVRRGGGPVPGFEIHAPDRLNELLPRANVLVICVPSTPATEGMIGASELALLPADAGLVNVARGAVVDEEALFNALKCGRLFAAGLDVWYRYPKAPTEAGAPSRFPFSELENVVLSPHRGGHVQETEVLRMEALAQTLNLAAAGEPLPCAVDLQEGY